MPVAICNVCKELVPYKKNIKKAKCVCGSINVSRIRGVLNERTGQWEYWKDGVIIKTVNCDNLTNEQ